jgi:hypothetical protein
MTEFSAKWPSETVTKLDAARRQLDTAITLWFNDGDTVSTYTLSHAAYEVIHNLTSEHRKGALIFDAPMVRGEYRKEVNSRLRNPANFFKHAARGKAENPTIEFFPKVSEIFMLFSSHALRMIQIPPSDAERVLSAWFMIHEPGWLTEEGRELFTKHVPADVQDRLRGVDRGEFFKSFLEARALNPFWGAVSPG